MFIKELRALIIGQCVLTITNMPSLLHNAGFRVDILVNSMLLANNKFISRYEFGLDFSEILYKLSQKHLYNYDLIVVGDDDMLKNIANSPLSTVEKLKILPIQSEENLSHLFSKIGLSKVLSQGQITTPEFIVANNISEAINGAKKIGYPILVKVDSSNGGLGVFECNNKEDFQKIDESIFSIPVLIQKKIEGKEIDLSAIYFEGKLIHVSYSITIKKLNKFGLDIVRTYKQLSTMDKELFLEMEKLGEILGADGFTSISCIESFTDKKRYFIEADMRPNSWVNYGKFYGDDPAVKLARWFTKKERAVHPFAENNNYPQEILLPNYQRLQLKELILNRYKVLKYLSLNDIGLLWAMFLEKLHTIDCFKRRKTNCL